MNSYNTNNLSPVFLKEENLRVLIIGGGNVALGKLNAPQSNSLASKIRVVATAINDEIKAIAFGHPGITLFERPYTLSDFGHIKLNGMLVKLLKMVIYSISSRRCCGINRRGN